MKDVVIKPFNAVIFGGDGDLSKRKIIPAFFHRFVDGQLKMPFRIICITRKLDDEIEFKALLTEFIAKTLDEGAEIREIDVFMEHLELMKIPTTDQTSFAVLKQAIEMNGNWQRVFYFSVPSSAFGEICKTLKTSKLINKNSKVVLEKPLGNSLKSSQEINGIISDAFNENQIFRIDHYLGKETVQNIMVLRFANHLFERAWNADNIESVQITVAERLGVEKRAGYYDQTGALLDMVQNHLLQILCLIAMEPPSNLNPDTVRNEKLKVLESLRFFDKSNIKGNIVRGQYTRGTVTDEKVNSYLEDIGEYDSGTETFVAIKAYIDNWRWKNTPFYLRTGKRMKKRYSDIVINFKTMPHNIFLDAKHPLKNKLIIRLQPEERIELVQLSKIPGPGGYRFKPISLKLDFVDTFKERMPDAYERLIIDILRGNQTLFMRHDELEAAWKWIESISDNWEDQIPLDLYESGSWGPGDQVLEEKQEWQTK
ncbi:MAG: glucose-6-phosphate 1-dehydrogenase [Crocinitomix sp.]|jgi:glucose-6-phosphate 1-dehydrogenase